MSHFYASFQGNRGEGTRGGNRASGIYGHVRGWNIGTKVRVEHHEKYGDVVSVYISGGSKDGNEKIDLGSYYVNEKGKYVKVK